MLKSRLSIRMIEDSKEKLKCIATEKGFFNVSEFIRSMCNKEIKKYNKRNSKVV